MKVISGFSRMRWSGMGGIGLFLFSALFAFGGSIAEAGAPEDADRLFQLLEGVRHPEGARALLKAAVSLSGEEGLDRCLGLLQESKEGDVRAAAADLIGHLNATNHIPQLLEVLAREDFGRAQWQLTQAIARAGGFAEWAEQDDIIIVRKGPGGPGSQVHIKFDYDRVVSGKDVKQNILLNPDDVIVVP